MANSNINENGKNIYIFPEIQLDQVVSAIASLGDLTDRLKNETWRLNTITALSSSLWHQVINKIGQDQSEQTRLKLYKLWLLNRYKIHVLVDEEKKKIYRNVDAGSGNNTVELETDAALLVTHTSLPLPERPNTRNKQAENIAVNSTTTSNFTETSFILTASEWKTAFSRTRQKLNTGWTDIFYDKLSSCGIICDVRFGNSHVRKGKRKRMCRILWVRAWCSNSECKRLYLIILKGETNVFGSVLFLLRISGEMHHNPDVETMTRQLRGKERELVGKDFQFFFEKYIDMNIFFPGERANEIGPLATLRERLESADKKLLAEGNFTRCETIETIKKASSDFRKKMQINEDIYQECRMVARAYRKGDVESEHVQGNLNINATKNCCAFNTYFL